MGSTLRLTVFDHRASRCVLPQRAPPDNCIPASSLFLSVTDVKDETIVLSDESLSFKGKSGEKEYSVNIEFLKAVNAEGSTYKVLPRSVQMLLKKVPDEDGGDEEFWPRLLKDKALEKNQVKIDWDRYVDEDEEEEGFDTSNLEGGMGMGGMPPGMGGMGGMPGMGGMGGMPGMGGMGGGMGGMDMEALMKQMGSMGGGEGLDGGPDGGDDDDDDDGDDDLPPLEEVE